MKSDLTTQEQGNVRLALKFLQIRVGSRGQLAKVLHVSESSFDKCRPITASLAFRVARFAKVGIDDLLGGKFPPAGTCPYCGHCAAADEPVGVLIREAS